MKYKIFTSEKEFEAKNTEIFESGVCGNATQYADLATSKHPQLDQWAMPVLGYAESFFEGDALSNKLGQDWFVKLSKK